MYSFHSEHAEFRQQSITLPKPKTVGQEKGSRYKIQSQLHRHKCFFCSTSPVFFNRGSTEPKGEWVTLQIFQSQWYPRVLQDRWCSLKK